MAWIEKKQKKRIYMADVGDRVEARRKLRTASGYFEKGTVLKVTGVTCYGYNLEDEFGHYVLNVGFHSVKVLS